MRRRYYDDFGASEPSERSGASEADLSGAGASVGLAGGGDFGAAATT